MDVNIFLGIAAFALNVIVMLGGAYAFVLHREGKLVEKMEKMHDEQEKRIREIEAENKSIRENYRARLDAMKDSIGSVGASIAELKTEILERINQSEMNMRESYHKQAENVSKAINQIMMKLAGQ